MSPLKRRKDLIRAGIAPAIPTVSQRRDWEFLDYRKKPEVEPDGKFTSHIQWVNKASSWIGWTGAKCFDSKGRICSNGGDMQRADEESAFPVFFYFPHHFKRLKNPTLGQKHALKYLSENRDIDLAEIKKLPNASQITWRNLEALLGHESFEETKDKNIRFLTDEGKGMVEHYIHCIRKASYVRA